MSFTINWGEKGQHYMMCFSPPILSHSSVYIDCVVSLALLYRPKDSLASLQYLSGGHADVEGDRLQGVRFERLQLDDRLSAAQHRVARALDWRTHGQNTL